jgi:hypothetical protein
MEKQTYYQVNVLNTDNADKFRPAAIVFEETGYYTPAPKGTKEYRRFWKEQIERSIHGYTASDGEYITGYYYFYLNFCRIIVTKEREYVDRRGIQRIRKERKEAFPWFYDYDRAYFEAIEEAENQGKHIALIKKRGSGYSFKGAAMLCRNYYCLPNSKSYAIASEMEFLTKDGLISKAWEMMAFIDQHTGMSKKRQKVDQSTHKKASFIKRSDDGTELEIGYKSEIMAISLKNDPQKARGKRGKLILWEEAGKFPNLKTAWQIARPSVEDDDGIAYGLMVAYGTGGSEDTDFTGLKDLFYEPKAYNALPIKNDWDEGVADKACGFFVPQYYNMMGFMDHNGNSDIPAAKKYSLEERATVALNATDKSSIDRYVAERPFTPTEACLQISGNIFPKNDLIRHLAEIRNSEALSTFKQVGELFRAPDGGIKWELNPNVKDHISYRLEVGADKRGAVVIWEHPVPEPPWGLYIIGVDPYDHDDSQTVSLGSCIVYKRFQKFEEYYDMPVAEYTGRPETAEEFYEQVLLLALYYNGTIMYENEKKGLFQFLEKKHYDYLLADQPGSIKDVIKDSKVNRNKGVHMPIEIKRWGERLTKSWMLEEYAPGRRNLTKIMSEPLLEELINYNEDGNFDRVMAFFCVMIYRFELSNIEVRKRDDEIRRTQLFPEPLFLDSNKMII